MSNWKLPEHLEPYREYIDTGGYLSIEDAFNAFIGDEDTINISAKLDLLQRLYDAGKLK